MAEKILNTRIQLKYDTLANWNASTFLLKRGELAIVEVPTAEGTTLPPVMFKVGTGDKKFSELDWASAKAADVYGWAKASGLTVEDKGSGKFVTGFTWTDNKLIITRSDVDWNDIQNKPLASATADGLMSSADKAKLDGMNLTTGAGVKAEVASSLDATGVAQVKAIKVDNATKADEATHATNADNAGTADKVAHTLTIDDKTFDGSADVDITATVKSLAATEIGRLIDVAGDDETLTNIGALVDYVENNAGEIAQLVTDVGTANTNASNAVSTANTAKSTAEDAASVAGEAKSLAEDAMDAASDAQTGAAASAAAAAESAEAAADSAADALAEKNAAVEAKTAAVAAQGAAETAKADAVTAKNAAVEAKEAADGYAADALASKNAAATSASQAATSAGNASTKAGEAAASATNALASENAAAQSKADANAAKEAAVTAQGKAEAAQSAAEKAKSDADNILTEVSDVASGAQATANSAVQTANTANQTANEAKSAAEGAVSTANAAKATADTALQNIKAGTGLKVSAKANNEQTVDIDESVIFIFDCGNATDKIYE